jgi:hypothetical protein
VLVHPNSKFHAQLYDYCGMTCQYNIEFDTSVFIISVSVASLNQLVMGSEDLLFNKTKCNVAPAWYV